MSASISWDPNMNYLPGCLRPAHHIPSLLEQYADTSIVAYRQTYTGRMPSHDHDLDIQTAVSISNTIDLVDSTPHIIDQIIWGITHPSDCHPGVRSIVENIPLVDLLLIRQFKKHGGIVLPPLPAARDANARYEDIAMREIAEGKTWVGGDRTFVRYPNWRIERLNSNIQAMQVQASRNDVVEVNGGKDGRESSTRGRGSLRGRGGFRGGY